MDDKTIEKLRNDFVTIVPAKYQTLYSGTKDLPFARAIAAGQGWQSLSAFRTAYCQQALGGTAVYGPGIYMTDVRKQAEGYGPYILVFTFKPAADYLDLADAVISRDAVKMVGGGKQTLLAEPNLDMLLRVTANYFVLRTQALVSVALEGDDGGD
jgi:hypothetical protein